MKVLTMRLTAVQEIKSKIDDERSKLETLKMATAVHTPIIDGLPRPTSQQSSRVEGLTVAILESERRIAELADEYVDAIVALTREIFQRVKDVVAFEVLLRRYILCKPFAEIATELGYSESRIFYWHRQGKNKFERTD